MRYDGGIRVAHYELGIPWAIGAGTEDQYPDLATIAANLPRLWLAAYTTIQGLPWKETKAIVMPNIEVNIELCCAQCGDDLCANAIATARRGEPCFQIDPCKRCLAAAYDRAFARGLAEAEE